MKITRPTEATVTFDNLQEAAAFLCSLLCVDAGAVRFRFPIVDAQGEQARLDRLAAVKAALEKIARAYNLTPEPADPEHSAPAYISGSSDKVYDLRRMPSRYIRNVLRMDSNRQAAGLVREMEAELRRRGEGI